MLSLISLWIAVVISLNSEWVLVRNTIVAQNGSAAALAHALTVGADSMITWIPAMVASRITCGIMVSGNSRSSNLAKKLGSNGGLTSTY